jgi:hypothetical protein
MHGPASEASKRSRSAYPFAVVRETSILTCTSSGSTT